MTESQGSQCKKQKASMRVLKVRKSQKEITKSANISNGNRTEWSPIRSVIIRVINKIRRPRCGSPICLITSMITDRIRRHENKICEKRLFFRDFLLAVKKKSHLRARVMSRTIQLLRHDAYCPIKLSY